MFFSLPASMLFTLPALNNVHDYTSLLLQTHHTDYCSPLSNWNRQFSLETDFKLTDLQATQGPYFRSTQQAVLLEWLTKRICRPHKVHIFVQCSEATLITWVSEREATSITLRSEWTRGYIYYTEEWVNASLHLLHRGVSEREATLITGVSEREATLITRVNEHEATLITGVSERDATLIT